MALRKTCCEAELSGGAIDVARRELNILESLERFVLGKREPLRIVRAHLLADVRF